jgi:peptide/nickel transport system substrate-binding protein
MWQLHKQARSEPDRQKRDELVYEILQIHVDEGPFWLGIIADLPRPAIIGNRVKNTPTRDQLPLGGWLGPWVVAYPGAITYPEQYYLDDMA